MTKKKEEKIEIKESKIFPIILLAGAGVGAYFLYKYFKDKEEIGYPKKICRYPYCFDVYNEEEETQMNDFLGIYPQGVDIDTYLSALTLTQLDEWKNYWINMWNSLGRDDIILFVNEMYDKYSGVAPPEGVSAKIDTFTITS